jgi:uncharacterized membrane protein
MGFVQHMQKSIDQNRALRKNHTSLKKQLTDKDLKSNLHQDLKYKKVSSEELENMKNEIQKKSKREKQIQLLIALIFTVMIVFVYFLI